MPDAVVAAAANGLRDLAKEPTDHPAHAYAARSMGIEAVLCKRLKALSPTEFEDLLHPVFQASGPISSRQYLGFLLLLTFLTSHRKTRSS